MKYGVVAMRRCMCVPILLANGHIRDEQRYATKEMTCMLFFLPLILILSPPPAPRPTRRSLKLNIGRA